MIIGIPKLVNEKQKISPITPESIKKILALGYQVKIEYGVGALANFTDDQWHELGANIVDATEAWASDIVLCAEAPSLAQIDLMKPGSFIISRLSIRSNPDYATQTAQRQITALAIEAVPRISRAQSIDVLSSLANLAGYRAVVEAAYHYGRPFTGQVTAAGKVPPAKVYVIGAGVAGIAAIGCASSMGAQVYASDLRPETAEQVQSMGAEFLPLPTSQISSDGYAKELDKSQAERTIEFYTTHSSSCNIVITTAQIPGRPAPIIISAQAVEKMSPGSVIVDLGTTELGGNCEITRPGEVYTTANGVTIVGYTDFISPLATQASYLYAQNIYNLLASLTNKTNQALELDLTDDIVSQITISHAGKVIWPPKPLAISATPKPVVSVPNKPTSNTPTSNNTQYLKTTKRISYLKVFGAGFGLAILTLLVSFAPTYMLPNFIILTLATICGFYVITNVTHALHTPLMSETNAISGIIVVGAIVSLLHTSSLAITVLALLAIFVASINIFGGFYVTHRMLKMFRKDK